MTASPMNFSTVPPWRSRAAFIDSKYRAMTSVKACGSSGARFVVCGLGFAKTMVTVFRLSRAATASAVAPHTTQYRYRAATSSPQT